MSSTAHLLLAASNTFPYSPQQFPLSPHFEPMVLYSTLFNTSSLDLSSIISSLDCIPSSHACGLELYDHLLFSVTSYVGLNNFAFGLSSL